MTPADRFADGFLAVLRGQPQHVKLAAARELLAVAGDPAVKQAALPFLAGLTLGGAVKGLADFGGKAVDVAKDYVLPAGVAGLAVAPVVGGAAVGGLAGAARNAIDDVDGPRAAKAPTAADLVKMEELKTEYDRLTEEAERRTARLAAARAGRQPGRAVLKPERVHP